MLSACASPAFASPKIILLICDTRPVSSTSPRSLPFNFAARLPVVGIRGIRNPPREALAIPPGEAIGIPPTGVGTPPTGGVIPPRGFEIPPKGFGIPPDEPLELPPEEVFWLRLEE